MEDNRKDSRIVESLASSQPLWFRVWSPNISAASSAFVAAFTAGVGAFFSGVGLAQWLVKIRQIPAEALVAASMAVGFGSAVAVFALVYFLDRLISTSRYGADYGEEIEDEEQTDGLVATNNPRQLVRLDGRMKALLQKFARRYPTVKTLAINRWEGGNSPFTRPEIRDLRMFLLRINAASQEGRRVELNAYGLGKLSEWAAGNFADTPLPQNGSTSPDIEVSHS